MPVAADVELSRCADLQVTRRLPRNLQRLQEIGLLHRGSSEFRHRSPFWITFRSAPTASCLLVDGIVIGGDILVIRSPESSLCGTFLSYVIRMDETHVLQLVTGSTVFHLYASDMSKCEFRMPAVDDQSAIATVLSDMDAAIDALEVRLAKTRALKAGMMQVLLTGRIRLV